MPIAYHIIWTTYGTWLPGDARGWVKKNTLGIQEPDAERERPVDGRAASIGGIDDPGTLPDPKLVASRRERALESHSCGGKR